MGIVYLFLSNLSNANNQHNKVQRVIQQVSCSLTDNKPKSYVLAKIKYIRAMTCSKKL